MSVTADVSDWIVTPALLNDKKSGERAIFSTDNSIVQRRDSENHRLDCVSYTWGPLPLGQVWQVTVLETTMEWNGYAGLVSGCVLSLLYHHIYCVLVRYKTSEDSLTGCIVTVFELWNSKPTKIEIPRWKLAMECPHPL